MAHIIPPGSVVGILGGGQLGRMMALAGARLGYSFVIYAPEESPPAALVAATHIQASYTDLAALKRFADMVDVITLEFENIPTETVDFLTQFKNVFPDSKALSTAQDRSIEKAFFNTIGIATAPWAAITTQDELTHALKTIGTPSVLKTARFGYDGKGQVTLKAPEDAIPAWESLQNAPCVLEGFVDFKCEISVLAARNPSGEVAVYAPVENIHKDHILAETIAPARLDATVRDNAQAIAIKAISELRYVGILAIELFVTKDGTLLVNEMAPRPHNSGHWTQDACACDQFEQSIRAVCNIPLGSTRQLHKAKMINLIGDAVGDWQSYLLQPHAKLHLYGKNDVKAGRKMGHVNMLYPDENTP
jgi:5-(carboxyamino)imidazole ribonucleotide synthase